MRVFMYICVYVCGRLYEAGGGGVQLALRIWQLNPLAQF